MPCPEDTEIFANKKMREGWALFNIIENWVQNNDNTVIAGKEREYWHY